MLLCLYLFLTVMDLQEIQNFRPFLEFGMKYKSLEFRPALKEESSRSKVDSMWTNYNILSLINVQR